MNIWNCFHGCKKYSEGCKNCYMFYLDNVHTKGAMDSSKVFLVKTQINYPLEKDRKGKYKIKSGDEIFVGLNTDFFLTVEEAETEEIIDWRNKVWEIIKQRPDVKFYFLTKRAFNIKNCLPSDWNDGYDNVMISVTLENQDKVDERLKYLEDVPAKHKGIMCAPLLSDIEFEKYLKKGFIERVLIGGENYGPDVRPCDYKWVKHISDQCKKYNITCSFTETGTKWIDKDGKLTIMPSKIVESKEAYLTNLGFTGKEFEWNLKNIDENNKFQSWYASWCKGCGSLPHCNGCNLCGKCGRKLKDYE